MQRYLGRELISDPNLAILEFVKNSYDAGATRVLIEFTLNETPTELLIADNGIGMSLSDFERNWMHPGFSEKSPDAPPVRPSQSVTLLRSEARKLQGERIPSGEKGLGRLAAGRLGDVMDVYSRTRQDDQWLHVRFDWSHFEDMSKNMNEIEIFPDFVDDAPLGSFETGTAVVISGLQQSWSGKVRGRPAAGRSRTILGRLRQDLQFFVRPLATGEIEGFEIELNSDASSTPDDLGKIKADGLVEFDYRYSFRFYKDSSGKSWIERTIERGGEWQAAGLEQVEALDPCELVYQTDDGKTVPAPLCCGDFSGEFLYFPPPAGKRAQEVTPMGVLLYRDGVWVEPYGIGENDWLLANARKAQRQGYAIQPASLTGHVDISRAGNPSLLDMSNRMGLLENDESVEFFHHLRNEIIWFEARIQTEVLEPRWEVSREQKAEKHALSEAQSASLFIRSLAHSIRQPLEALQTNEGLLEDIVSSDKLSPKDVRDIREIAQETRELLSQVSEWVEQALRIQVSGFSEVSVNRILVEALSRMQGLCLQAGVDLDISDYAPTDAVVLIPEAQVWVALDSLVANAISAPRPPGRKAAVKLEAVEIDNGWTIRICDNGEGIPGFFAGMDISSIKSTRGRPGMGLKLAELSIISAQGRLKIQESSTSGTVMDVRLSSRIDGLSLEERM